MAVLTFPSVLRSKLKDAIVLTIGTQQVKLAEPGLFSQRAARFVTNPQRETVGQKTNAIAGAVQD